MQFIPLLPNKKWIRLNNSNIFLVTILVILMWVSILVTFAGNQNMKLSFVYVVNVGEIVFF